MRNLRLLAALMLFGFAFSAPTENSLVVSSTELSKENGGEHIANSSHLYPIIYEMDINSKVSNRFAKTLVVSKVKNSEKSAKETTFTVVLPEKAFISEFVMEIDGKSYKAHVKEKEEAKNIYDQARASGQSAAHVSVSARDSNKFTVSVNIEPESKAVFLLTYEELLQRKNDQYELVLNIHPGQIVKKLNVQVQINESRPLVFVKTPSLRSGNEISKNEDKLDPSSDIEIINSTTAVVKFSPDTEKQKEFALNLEKKESDGLSGQFVVQYDVKRDPYGGEVLLKDGYFVHFFAPSDLKPLPKHVVFVLDTSGSMHGEKITQLKDAMNGILGEINKEDLVDIIEFSNDVQVWDVISQRTVNINQLENYDEPFGQLSETNIPAPTIGNDDNINKAKNVIKQMEADGGTYIIGGLETALYMIKKHQEKNVNQTGKQYQPIIIFLTDGQPNVGVYSTEEIVQKVTQLNSKYNNVPIFSLSFGYGANKDFLRKLSLKNHGFSRHIYEASDASLQLQEFYKQISSPLLSNIKFKYESEVNKVTKAHFPIYFRGSELVVTGQYKDSSFPSSIDCWGPTGPIILRPRIERPISSLERLWAYLTVKQTLEERDSVDNKTELTKKALDIALKYSFVTDVTSLVVVKPNDTSAVNTEEAAAGVNSYESGIYPGAVYKSVSYSSARNVPQYHQYSASYDSTNARGGSNVPQFQYAAASYDSVDADDVDLLSVRVVDDSDNFGSQPSSTYQPVTSTVLPHLGNSLPWLASVTNPNGTITISQNVYELGENSSMTFDTECPRTPANSTETGICTLLKDCLEVHSSLVDFHAYQQYFCSINNKFAGVCCPKKSDETN